LIANVRYGVDLQKFKQFNAKGIQHITKYGKTCLNESARIQRVGRPYFSIQEIDYLYSEFMLSVKNIEQQYTDIKNQIASESL